MLNKTYYPEYKETSSFKRQDESDNQYVNREIHSFRRDLKSDWRLDTSSINKAFRKLRTKGWVARMNFTCCGSCGCAELKSKYGLEDDAKFVFYHQQGNDSLKEHGRTSLVWGGTVKDGGELVDILDEFGLLPVWNGSTSRTIRIHLPNGLVEKVFGQFDKRSN